MFTQIAEGDVKLFVPKETKISKELPVFYNPVMRRNRDLSILLLKALQPTPVNWVVGLPLAGTGVRAMRFLKELPSQMIERIDVNDHSKEAVDLIKENLKLNNLLGDVRVNISCLDANTFLQQSTGYHYIDIDPFGSPNPFLDRSIVRLSRGGILAISATDTAALCGAYPKVCRRKYWAENRKGVRQHERGLRILIRKVQLIAAQYDKALIPVFSYWHEHYFRVFFRCTKSREEVDKVLRQQGEMDGFGPLWLGSLFDPSLVVKMHDLAAQGETKKFLALLVEESAVNVARYFDLHEYAQRKGRNPPSTKAVIAALKTKGYQAARTHLCVTGLISDAPFDVIEKVIEGL